MITENDRNILALAQLAAEGAPPKIKATYKASILRASMLFTMRQTSENQETLENQRQALANQVQEPVPVPVPEEMQAAQEGGPIQNAETDLEAMLGPMGVINDNDGSPGPSLGGEGVADDLTMEVPEGSYILNSDAVSLIGISDINTVIRDAYTIAAALGQELPADYDPQNKVPIRISNGEAVIPAPLVGVIGLDRLERWNAKGLEVRRQREEAEKAQAETQAAQPVTEAPPVQPMQAQMGEMMGFKDGDEVKDNRDLIGRIVQAIFGADTVGDLKKEIGTKEKDFWTKVITESGYTTEEIEKELSGALEKAEGGIIKSFKEGGFLNWLIPKLKDVGAELGLRGTAFDLGPIGKINVGLDLYHEESVLEAAELAGSLLGNTAREKRNAINLLKGTAAAESDLGETGIDINRPSGEKEGFTIGPFQVTKLALDEVKSRVKFSGMKQNIAKIKQHDRFEDVDFSKIDVDDLKDPYINAVIARLYYSINTEPIPENLEDQAAYWKLHYNTTEDLHGDPQTDYIDKVNQYDLFSKFEPIPKQRPEID